MTLLDIFCNPHTVVWARGAQPGPISVVRWAIENQSWFLANSIVDTRSAKSQAQARTRIVKHSSPVPFTGELMILAHPPTSAHPFRRHGPCHTSRTYFVAEGPYFDEVVHRRGHCTRCGYRLTPSPVATVCADCFERFNQHAGMYRIPDKLEAWTQRGSLLTNGG